MNNSHNIHVIHGTSAQREQLSALVDGELSPQECAQVMAWATQDEGQEDWAAFHMVGDVLRSPELAHRGSADFMAEFRQRMAQEPALAPVPTALQAAPAVATVAPVQVPAANESVFRWKMVAGLASVAAVAAIGWSSVTSLPGSGGAPGSQMAAAPAVSPETVAAPMALVASQPTAVAVAGPEGSSQVMLRDPRLDELLAAHKQYSGTTALQMPADFLRNANFDKRSR